MNTDTDLVNRAATTTDAEKVGGVSEATARRMRRRGDLPRRAVTLADSLARLVADELVALGMLAATAAAATRHLTEEDWTRVVGGEDGRHFFLVAEAAGDGVAVVTIADDSEVGEHLGRGALAVDLTGVAEVALTRLSVLLTMP